MGRQPKFSDMETPHVVKKFLALHESMFSARYGAKPAKYTARDAKHAKELIAYYGFDSAVTMLRRFFNSCDLFIVGSGHGLAVLASSNVQNKLIAGASGVVPKPAAAQPTRHTATGTEQQQKTAERDRLVQSGLSREEANRQVGW